MKKLLIFSGTTEGRLLAGSLCRAGHHVTVSVATEYGKELAFSEAGYRVWTGRLDREEMEEKLKAERFDAVIDATHPYAVQVTENLKSACEALGISYYRLKRMETSAKEAVYVSSPAEAVQYLEQTSGKVLLTTGAKELSAYASLSGFSDRVYARVLPCVESIEACQGCGLTGGHILAMQGPFSEEMNLAVLRQINAEFLVTKSSGTAGGFDEKVRAAKRAGAVVIVIGRTQQETGFSMEELCGLFGVCQELAPPAYFPMFFPLQGKRILVVGAGAIAARRIQTLKRFGCYITVVATRLSDPVRAMADRIYEREFADSDCGGMYFVLAATNDRAVNHHIVSLCRNRGILVNAADCKEECDFYFPAVAEHDGLVFGICSSGADHRKVKQAANFLRREFGRKQEGLE